MSKISSLDDGRISFRPRPSAATVLDPVCGMQIEPSRAFGSQEWSGQRYHFCSSACLSEFSQDPHRYVPRSPLP